MKLSNEEIRILKDLYRSSDGLSPFVFFQRYKYSPAVVFEFSTKFSELNFIEVSKSSGKFNLTNGGRDFVLKSKLKLSNDIYSNMPEGCTQPALKVNEPYLPIFSKLPKELLNL
ncbi:hypothetical protein GU926_00355 [Nibribacter ruber]|uniref:Uncharacterized protein n=1 Tax=Nibribacter ruber TaxID=2698458 RepID=A0A6P1NW16_9BACT|nr:hypothetical protein [Nibribacter ruber]QHL85975.1 hypothetical protein GU926_00355 [Nibribacter ruber]